MLNLRNMIKKIKIKVILIFFDRNSKVEENVIPEYTITINGNYIKITFTSSEYASGLNFYGLKATIIPNY